MSCLFEMHAHTKGVSACAHTLPEELAALYENTEYRGIVLTNHLNSSTFRCAGIETAPWREKADFFIDGYRRLKEILDGKMTVLLGFEINFYGKPNDYLVYGATEDFIKSNGDLMAMKIKDFSELAHENGLLFIQAHPFRQNMQMVEPALLDGYEVNNGNPRHDSRNPVAAYWADYVGARVRISGSDFHDPEDACRGGIYFDDDIKTNAELTAALLNGKYRLKTDF